MVMRTSFDGLTTPDARRSAHEVDHRQLHRAHNQSVYADDYASLQAAVDAADARRISHVILNPTATYTLAKTLVLPAEVTLDGGGVGATSNDAPAKRHRARLLAGAALDPMVKLGLHSDVLGCWIDGNNQAVGAIFAQDTVGNVISDNFIDDFTSYGLKFGGALFPTMKRNTFTQIDGYGLDALNAYSATPANVYYGINVGLSERNEYKGGQGALRLEGQLASVNDDFEGTNNGWEDGYITLGGTVTSKLDMVAPYFELTHGSQPIKAVKVGTDCYLTIMAGEAFGKVEDTGAVFIDCDNAGYLNVQMRHIARFAKAFTGAVRAAATVTVLPTRFLDVPTINDIDFSGVTSGYVWFPQAGYK